MFLEQHDVDSLRHTFTRLFLSGEGTKGRSIAEILLQLAQPVLTLSVHNVQLGLLISAWLTSVAQQFVIGPVVTRAMVERQRLTEEVARKKDDKKTEAALRSASKKFGMLHGISSLYNLYILLVVLVHGLYFASVVLQYATPKSAGATHAAGGAKRA